MSTAVAAGCTTEPTESAPSASTSPFGAFDPPPPIVIHTTEGTIAVAAFGYHTPTGIADGTTLPTSGPEAVVNAPELVFEFPLAGWDFEGRVTTPGDSIGPGSTVRIEELGAGRYQVRPTSDRGTVDVWLEGTGDRTGASYVFRWISPTAPSRLDVYEAVIRHLARFAPPPPWTEAVIAKAICANAGAATAHAGCEDQFRPEDEAALIARLADLAPVVRFAAGVANQWDVKWAGEQAGVVIWLGPIMEGATHVRIAASVACGGVCGTGATWTVEHRPEGWTVTESSDEWGA
jgi:hypothetical protein